MKKAVLLISGGIDSPVAGHMVLDKNIELIALHLSQAPITGDEPEEKSRKACKILGIKTFDVVNIAKQLEEIAKTCERKYYFILQKRLMLKEAEKIAKKHNCEFIVTGEALGQVSSQTPENLNIVNKATDLPVIRPLIGLDKNKIIDIAREIGTLEVSTGPEVCDALGPKTPSAKANEELVLIEEAKLNF